MFSNPGIDISLACNLEKYFFELEDKVLKFS
jgi:hypothetical protein